MMNQFFSIIYLIASPPFLFVALILFLITKKKIFFYIPLITSILFLISFLSFLPEIPLSYFSKYNIFSFFNRIQPYTIINFLDPALIALIFVIESILFLITKKKIFIYIQLIIILLFFICQLLLSNYYRGLLPGPDHPVDVIIIEKNYIDRYPLNRQ